MDRCLVNASNEIGDLSGTSQGNISLAAGTALTVNQSGTTAYAGSITGSGAFVKGGTGTLTLSGSTSHTGGTSVLGGTLAGTTSALRGNILNNATVAFNQAFGATASANISGTGRVTFGGGASYSLTGTNSYTGGTTVDAATTISGSTSSIQGDIANSGTVTFTQGTAGTHAGAITGAGSVGKTGVGTLTLTGANTYTGGTTIFSGMLVGTTSSLQRSIDNRSALVFDQSFSGTFTGGIFGAGSVTKTGSGTVTLTGGQSYTGGTFVLGGTLAGDTASLQGSIVNNANVEFWQRDAGTFFGVISGSGQIVKTGAGTLTFGGANAYSGGTTIADGVLAIASDASLGQASGGLTFSGGTLRLNGG